MEAEPELAVHCSLFHQAVNCDAHLNWHVHVLLPWATGESSSQDMDKPADPVLKGEVVVDSASVPLPDVDLTPVSVLEFAVANSSVPGSPQRPSAASMSFLTDLLGETSLRAVTGVALC